MQYSTSQAVALTSSGEVLCPVCLQVLDDRQQIVCFNNSVCAVGTGWSARCALFRLTNLMTHSCCDAKPKRIQPHPSACLPVWIHLCVHFEKYYLLWYNCTGWLGVKLQATFFWNTVTEVLRLRCYILSVYLLSASQFWTWSECPCTQAHFHEYFLAFIPLLFFSFKKTHIWNCLLVQQSCWILTSHQLQKDTSRDHIWYSHTHTKSDSL